MASEAEGEYAVGGGCLCRDMNATQFRYSLCDPTLRDSLEPANPDCPLSNGYLPSLRAEQPLARAQQSPPIRRSPLWKQDDSPGSPIAQLFQRVKLDALPFILARVEMGRCMSRQIEYGEQAHGEVAK
jgi:hypothetical protein